MQSKLNNPDDTYNSEPTAANKVQIRLDKFNIPILKKTKVHRVVFRDECQKGKTIADIHIVQNWKRYNQLNEESAKTCCSIF
ncbi:unnamed protein product [Paramecium sonneborni]|uniref:Uncharacterized protein n=1 Tax=Paramecium sonneborni TaxID=65129 RepID=A0A8S1QYG1_9CILI|nr:unnamed protein product [Paramecium sonneborni]